VAENGKKAVECLEKKEYDLVLMDIQMPEMDGIEAARIIRDPDSAVCRHDVPVIAMTANVMKGDREAYIEAGINDYIAKPFESAQLLEVIEKNLGAFVYESKIEDKRTIRSDIAVSLKQFFDKDALFNRLGCDEGLYKHILKSFLDYMPLQIEKLKSALDDTESLILQAHNIKGMCANISAEKLRETAYQIEAAGRDGDLNTACSLTDRLEEIFYTTALYQKVAGGLGDYTPLLDIKDILERYDGKEEKLREMLGQAVKDIPEQMAHLEEHLSRGDIVMAANTAHSIANLTSAIRASFAFSQSGKLEQAARNYDLKQAQALYEELKDEIGKILEILEDLPDICVGRP
jgi:CheY-like chemotaxis protein